MSSPRRRQPKPLRPRRTGWHGLSAAAKGAYIGLTIVVVAAAGVSLTGYALYLRLNDNVTSIIVGGLSGRSNYGAQNIIILGSQTRDGQGPGFGYDPNTNLSDNLLLVHLDTTHTHATILSIPRDTMVYEPACTGPHGGVVPAQQQAIIDGAMNLGGPSCAVATVEHLTGITLDHFIEFDFNSFRTMVDTIGGVEVCLPQAVNDPYSNLHLSAGRHLITGNQALAFVRTRHGVGDGTDLGRIELQQEFFSSLIQKVKSENTLENPVELLDIANIATKALTVDTGLGSVSKLLSLAATLRNLHTNDVTFITMPTILDPANNNRLLPEQPEDDILFQMLQTGQLWQGGLPVTPASTVTVNVLNGTGQAGLAAKTAGTLRQFGFHVGSVGDAPYTSTTTVSYPGPGEAGGAYALMGTLKQAPAVQDGVAGPITLTLGGDFAGVNSPPPPPASPSASASPANDLKPRPAPSPSASAPAVSATPDAGQQPDGTQPIVPGQSSAIESRNAATNICSGTLPGANPAYSNP
jgi:LCP family protein required for cell wall assembly